METSSGSKCEANVKVIVRLRPPNHLEKNGDSRNIVEIMNENILVFDPKPEPSPRSGRRRPRDLRKRQQKDLKFAFDRVFGWDSRNDEVFEVTTKTVLDGMLSGYNCSVFAYGATGAGKTFTMLGSESQPGVIYHTMIHLYKQISLINAEKVCDVAVSYLEVYNEQIRDLLLPRGTLPIRENPSTGVVISGLSLHKPSNADELLYMLQFGNKNRTQHPTDANAESSRSHAVFQVFVRQRDRTANISAEVKVAKMCLVDLAGSERATVNKNRGARFREGANINRSLLALGNVINALADQKYKGHIPYRDSKLTRLLKDSLGGNCQTIMIAAISPSHLTYEDTYNTLKYADRAKNIRLNMKKNVLNVDFHISRYGQIVEELRMEITELKSKLEAHEQPKVCAAFSLPADLQSLRHNLQAVYNDRRVLRDQQLKQETSVRDIQWRLHCTRKCLNRASQLSIVHPKALQKMQGVMQCLQKKLMGQETHRLTLSQQLQDNTLKLSDMQSRIVAAADNSDKSSLPLQMMEASVQKLALEVELNDCKQYMHHLRRLARAQDREAASNETLIAALLNLVQRQHMELQSRGPLSQEVSSVYKNVFDMVGQWGVSWADMEGQEPERDGSDHQPFHINTIIDIPLITNAGAAMNRVPLPGQTVASASLGTDFGPSGLSSQNKATVSCPGRVINGPVGFPTASPGTKALASSVVQTAVTKPPAVPATGKCLSSSHAVKRNPPTALAGQQQPLTPREQKNSAAASFGNTAENMVYAGDYDLKDIPSSTVHAGHTPNPKMLAQTTGRQLSDLHSQSVHNEEPCKCPENGSLACEIKVPQEPDEYVRVSPVHELPHNLNETFSLDSEAQGNHSIVNEAMTKVNCLLTVPVIDPSLSPSAKRTRNNGHQFCSARNALSRGNTPTYNTDLLAVNGQNVRSAVIGNSNSACANNSLTPVLFPHETVNNSTSGGADENSWICENRCPGAKRAIDFNSAIGTPQRVDRISYADVVKTPSPVVTRQPLQNLDCNSPEVHARPPSSGWSGLYTASPQIYDNIRRLKQLGMPSLVEDLLTGSKPGGSGDLKKPSYMQLTRSHAQRVRQVINTTRDDSFHHRRSEQRLMAHSRSKSTSVLNRSGWKV